MKKSIKAHYGDGLQRIKVVVERRRQNGERTVGQHRNKD